MDTENFVNVESSKSFYGSNYQVDFNHYDGFDFSKRCFVFSGQSVSRPGMFDDLFNLNSNLIQKLKEVDDLAISYNLPPLTDFIFNNQEAIDKLSPMAKQKVKSLSLFTCQVLVADFYHENGKMASYTTSHSFGEYASLVFAKIISFADAFDLVFMREHLSPPPFSSGGMIAVACPASRLEDIEQKFNAAIANINSPKQVVVSIDLNDLKRFQSYLKENKIAAQVLKDMPHAYHTYKMDETSNLLLNYLKEKKIKFSPPVLPLLSSVTGELITAENYLQVDFEKLIASLLTTQVDFPKQINQIYGFGIRNFLEISPMKVCCRFVEYILVDKTIKAEDVQFYLEKLNRKKIKSYSFSTKQGKFFKQFSQFFSKVTGYTVSNIKIVDNFQEDLGVDSIKKAEIIVNFIESSNITIDRNFNLANLQSIGDLIEYLEKPKVKSTNKNKSISKYPFQRFVMEHVNQPLINDLLKPQEYFNVNLSQIVESPQKTLTWIDEAITNFFKVGKKGFILVFNNDLSLSIDTDLKTLQANFLSVWRFLKALLLDIGSFSNLERKYLYFTYTKEQDFFSEALVSFFHSLKKEYHFFNFKAICFEQTNVSMEKLQEILIKEIQDVLNSDVFYNSKFNRFIKVLKLETVQNNFSANLNSQVVVTIGGAKGILFELLKKIDKVGVAFLYIIGRTSPNNSEIEKNLRQLKKLNLKVEYLSLDATDKLQFVQFIDTVLTKHQQIDYLINSSGMEVSKSFVKKDEDETVSELNSKLLPAFNINGLKDRNIKNIIHFSSIVSLFGNEGQTTYCFNNRLLDFYARNSANIKVIHWPAWNNVGMTTNKGVLEKFKTTGLSLLETKEGQEFFLKEMFDWRKESCSVYFMDRKDVFLYNYLNFDNVSILSNYGVLADPFSFSFKKRFSLKNEYYLKDHKLGDSIYVFPASYALAMFFLQGQLWCSRYPVLLNFDIKNVLVLSKLDVEINIEWSRVVGRENFYSSSINSNIKNFTCEMDYETNEQFVTQPVNDFKPLFKINLDSYYGSNCLDFGFHFQVMQNAYVNDKKQIQVVNKISNFRFFTTHNFFEFFTILCETCLQTLGTTILENHLVTAVPTSVERVEYLPHENISDEIYCYCNIEFAENDKFKGSAYLVDTKGDVVLKIQGIWYKTIKKYEKIPFTKELI